MYERCLSRRLDSGALSRPSATRTGQHRPSAAGNTSKSSLFKPGTHEGQLSQGAFCSFRDGGARTSRMSALSAATGVRFVGVPYANETINAYPHDLLVGTDSGVVTRCGIVTPTPAQPWPVICLNGKSPRPAVVGQCVSRVLEAEREGR